MLFYKIKGSLHPSTIIRLYDRPILIHTMKKICYLLAGAALLFASACTDENATTFTGDAREKFVGTWSCRETIAGSAMTFNININKFGESDTVQIYNFSNYGSSAVATGFVSGNSLTIPSQQIGITNIDVGGSGVYSDAGGTEKITMSYMTDGDNATAVCTK